MDFCDFCHNMYYIKEDEDKLVYYCKNCSSQKDIVESQGAKRILTNNYESSANKYSQYLNNNIIYDNTIPHLNNIKCGHKDCTKGDDEENDIMAIKYDNKNINYLYYCTYCKFFWSTKQ